MGALNNPSLSALLYTFQNLIFSAYQRQHMTASSCERSIYISAGVRMCVNGFLLRCVQRKRHSVSSREIIDTATSRIDSNSCSPPFYKSHQFLCLTCTVCSTHNLNPSTLCNPLKTTLSDWSIPAVTKWMIVLEAKVHTWPICRSAQVRKMFK